MPCEILSRRTRKTKERGIDTLFFSLSLLCALTPIAPLLDALVLLVDPESGLETRDVDASAEKTTASRLSFVAANSSSCCCCCSPPSFSSSSTSFSLFSLSLSTPGTSPPPPARATARNREQNEFPSTSTSPSLAHKPSLKPKRKKKKNNRWTPDDLFGSVVSCDRDNRDLVLLHPVRYGDQGPFAVSLWVKAAKGSGAGNKKAAAGAGGESLFEYALSHGVGASPDAFSPSDPFSGPGVHVLLPRGGHGASGLVRAVVKDADDVPGRSFLDSDGRVNDDGDRAAAAAAAAAASSSASASASSTSSAEPSAKADDGGWHHVVVSSRPEGGDGFVLYVDGRLRGEVPAPPGAAPAGETLFADGGGSLKASGLANSSIYLCGRSDGAVDRFFSGSVAHVGFWDQALDSVAASALFESVPVAGSSSGAAAKAAAKAAETEVASVAAAVSEQPAAEAASSAASAAPVSLLASSPSAAPKKPVFTVSGVPCSFPFNYGGLERWECVPSAADGGASSFCQDAAGHLSRCAAPDSDAELEEKFGALRSYLDQYVAAPGGALVAGPDGKVALCSRRRGGGSGDSGKKAAAAGKKDDPTTQLLLPTECPGSGDGAVCARLTKSQVARLGPFPSDEARDAFAAGDAGVCARPQGSLLPAEAGDPVAAAEAETTAAASASASASAAAAAAAAKDASTAVPLPSAYFPLSNYSSAAWPVPELALRNLTLTNTTKWVEDSTFGTALECSRADSTNGGAVTSSKDAAALLPNVPLGPGGAFAVNLWMRQYSSPGKKRREEKQRRIFFFFGKRGRGRDFFLDEKETHFQIQKKKKQVPGSSTSSPPAPPVSTLASPSTTRPSSCRARRTSSCPETNTPGAEGSSARSSRTRPTPMRADTRGPFWTLTAWSGPTRRGRRRGRPWRTASGTW